MTADQGDSPPQIAMLNRYHYGLVFLDVAFEPSRPSETAGAGQREAVELGDKVRAYLGEAHVPARIRQRGVKLAIGLDPFENGTDLARCGGSHQPRHRPFVSMLNRKFDATPFVDEPDLIHLHDFGQRKRFDPVTASRSHLDQVLFTQPQQRLADRGFGDPETAAQLLLEYLLTGSDLAGKDFTPKLLVDRNAIRFALFAPFCHFYLSVPPAETPASTYMTDAVASRKRQPTRGKTAR